MEDSDCFSLIDENDSLISPDADADADDASLTHLHSGSILVSRFTFSDVSLLFFQICMSVFGFVIGLYYLYMDYI